MDAKDPCPCQSNVAFGDCCQPILDGGAAAQTPQQLMRSRYTGYYLGKLSYLLESWHPQTRPASLDHGSSGIWVGLEVIDSKTEASGDEGMVEFRAKMIHNNLLELLHEKSLFNKIEGRWYYHSGELRNRSEPPKAISKNSLCPCGSQLKFKRCHYV